MNHPLEILHLSVGDSGGGASRAAYRIHEALVKSGIKSRMRVLKSDTSDDRVTGGTPKATIVSRINNKLHQRWLSYTQRGWHTNDPVVHSFGQTGAGLVNELNSNGADILNLHWVAEMLSVKDIGALKKPIVWTLHDMWPFCGGEHYAPDTETARFRQGYRAGNRPIGESGPDLNRQTWEAKQRAWSKHNFTVVTPSRWLAECSQQSILFGNMALHVIPNPLDTVGLWRPISREVSRVALGLPQDKRLILMGSFGGTVDPRKGGDLLQEAMALVVTRSVAPVELVVYGQSQPADGEVWPLPVHWLGKVRDDRVLALAYSAADLMVVPSRQDNLPNTAVEAQACGTPVVAFDVGGLPDIVVHRETGWLAKAFDIADMAEGILWVLSDEVRRSTLSNAARKRAVKLFSESVVAGQYAKLYEEVLSSNITL